MKAVVEQPVRGYARCSDRHTWRATCHFDEVLGHTIGPKQCPECGHRFIFWGRTPEDVKRMEREAKEIRSWPVW